MSDSHDLHVLRDLIAAVHATPGAPEAAAAELDAHARAYGEGEAGGLSMIEAAREAIGGLVGKSRPQPVGIDAGGEVQKLAALLARMESALSDDRLSGPARDAVLRAFDPVKDARDAALQRANGG